MKIKPKLYLNMSPQTAEEGSLAFARNMKIDDDGNLVSDYGYKNIAALSDKTIVGHIVGLDNKIYFFCHTEHQTEDDPPVISYVDEIVEYDEVEETAITLTTQWTYSGGEIDGYVNTNQSGEKILTIGEYLANGSSIPLKHINLKYANVEESLYSQAPKCPTANLVLTNTYVKTIPNGVYVFFIRYKIRKDVYTNWFLCSRPIFGGTSEKITTLQGGLSYINLHKDSAKSFVFNLNFAQKANIDSYPEFQLGFIITHDEATDARMWKHFNMSDFKASGGNIYFDYEDVSDANIDDLLETTYELYNVRNVTAFKNKLYISNYIESNFNPDDIATIASKIHLSVKHSGGTDINYRNLKLNNTPLNFNYTKGYYDETTSHSSIASLITSSSLFNYDISKLSKVSSKEKNDVLLFDIIWKGDAGDGGYNPDIAIVYNIFNNLYNQVKFGPNYGDPYTFDTRSMPVLIDKGMGIKLVATDQNLYGYIHDNDTLHPWYNLGFAFAFGSFSARDVGSTFARDGAFPFKNSNETTWQVDGVSSWPTRDSGFLDSARNFIDNTLKKQIEDKSFWGKAYIEISSGGNTYNIGYDPIMDRDDYAGSFSFVELANALFSTETISYTLKTYIESWIYNVLSNSNYLKGIDESGIPVLEINGKTIRANSVSIRFKKFDFKVEVEELTVESSVYNKRYRASMTTTDYVSVCTFNFKNGIISIGSTSTDQASTLMPYSKYQPYVHFVDDNNIITNGVKCGGPIQVTAATSNADVISLQYYVDALTGVNTNYKSFFISLVNIGNIVMEGFGYCKDPNSNTTNILQCLEIDAMLYNINDNIIIVDSTYNPSTPLTAGTTGVITTDAKYYSSASNYPTLAFGNCGYISWEGQASDNYGNSKLYIIIVRNKTSENINDLTKSSGYIKLEQTGSIENQADVPDGYYGSWLSFVKKPSFDLASSCYVSGNDVYAMDRNTSLGLRDFNGYVQVQNSVTYFIRSNYNLNYLSLTEDIGDKVFNVGSASSGVKQVAKVINSAILSFIYELKPMYKSFSNKYFRRFDSDYKIDFDNTVRVSHVLSDETFNNSIFKFDSEDYYNVPTDRGVIINLFAISSNIFVHTETAFYKFDGNQTIASSNNDITLRESEPFETGVTQLFDSEYGYGGIHNKEAGCITFDSYIFYDAMSNHIFAYGGNSQVQLIDASIYKMLCYYKPTYCRTLHDDANHRVLFEFTTNVTAGDYKTFTISYNYKSKSFVSLHDLSLEKAFHSRYLSYSYKRSDSLGLSQLFVPTKTIDNTVLNQNMNIYKIYGEASAICFIQFGADGQEVQSSPFNIAVVIFPQETYREAFNSLKYIGDVVKDNYDEKTNYEVIKFPQVTRTNPVSKFYVVTDRCVSTPVTGDVNDAQRPANPDDYKGFKYDMGSWNTNYFRNALDTTNIYQYPNQPGTNIPISGGTTVTRNPNADNNSLVYGKYFILVFDFIKNQPIKIEEVSVNSNRY